MNRSGRIRFDLTSTEINRLYVTSLSDAFVVIRCLRALRNLLALANSFELYQAQGMVAVQLGVGLDEAMMRIRAHAYAHHRSLSDVADDIVAGRVALEADM